MKHYDYIIAGGGCAGRSLAVQLIPYLNSSGKKVLLVDKLHKNGNDKTWCFWETTPGLFEPIVHRQWNRLLFAGTHGPRELDIHPYRYKMIRSADFYQYTNDQIANCPQIHTLQGNVEQLYHEKEKAYAVIDGEKVSTDYIFSSISKTAPQEDRYQYFLQHFTGWVIETGEQTFDTAVARLMDFNTSQQHGTAFFYVLPLAPGRALVEYTVFSKQLLQPQQYKAALEQYIHEQLHCPAYAITEVETGVIPMTDQPFPRTDGPIIYVGTAGGFTKGSTGYTFRFIQQHTAAIARQLETAGHPYLHEKTSSRFRLYDSILLHVLNNRRVSGKAIFSAMFEQNKSTRILKFLDNETNLWEELRLFSTLQVTAFISGFASRLAR